MSIVITLEVDDKGSAKIKKFSNEADKDLGKVEKKGGILSKELGSGFEKVGKASYNASVAIAKFALELSAISVVAGASALALVTKEASALEQQMDFLGAVLKDKTEANFNELSNVVLDLGANTEWMSTQVAGAGENLAKAGFATEEVIGALPGTLSLATAGTIDLAEAADVTASTLRSFGIQASEATKVADVLAFTATNTNTTVSSIGEAMKYVAPLSRTAGISLQETSAAIGLLGNVGIQASMAGTTLRAAIASLLSPTEEQTKLMQDMGLKVTDSSGKLVSLTTVLQQLKEAGATTGEVIELFGRRGGPGMAALLSMGSDALRELTIETENAGGAADRVAQEKLDNFRGQITLLQSAIQNMMIALGSPMLPTFSDYIKVNVIPTVQSMVEYIKENEEGIKDFGQGVVDAVSMSGEALSAIISFMQSVGLPILATIFSTIGDTIGFVSAAIVTLIDILSKAGNAVIELQAKFVGIIPGLDGVANSMRETKYDSTELKASLENIGVSSIAMGDKLSSLTMDVADFSFGLTDAVDKTYKTKEAMDETTKSTSTLADTVDGSLNPGLQEALLAFEEAERQAALLGNAEYNLQDDTFNTVDNMNSKIDTLNDSWGSVNESIYGTDTALSDLNKNVNSMNFGGGVNQTGANTYEVKATGQDVKAYYEWLATVSPNVVAFAEGGIVTKPSLGLLGEAGPEMVIPLDRLDDFYLRSLDSSKQNMQNNSMPMIQVQLTLNDKVLAESIIDINDKNTEGYSTKFFPLKNNISNFQEKGA